MDERRTFLDFESGFLVVGGEKHFIMPQSEVRDFMNHQILRVSGILDNGDVFWIYGLKDDSNYEMFGKLFTP